MTSESILSNYTSQAKIKSNSSVPMNNCLPSLDELFEQLYAAKPLQASHLNHKEKLYITKSLIWAVA